MGYENILVIIDHFTKFTQAYPTKNQKATTTAKFVPNFIPWYGFQRNFIQIKDKHLWVKSWRIYIN